MLFHGWMQKLTHQLDPQGPCQVITKERPIDRRIGDTKMNEAVQRLSQGALEDVLCTSIIEKPMTPPVDASSVSRGVEPLSNGVCIANREYAGMTPIGMTFPELASMTGGGVQTHSSWDTVNISSLPRSSMKAEGGIERIVCMDAERSERSR